jgi:hypothetical protein
MVVGAILYLWSHPFLRTCNGNKNVIQNLRAYNENSHDLP